MLRLLVLVGAVGLAALAYLALPGRENGAPMTAQRSEAAYQPVPEPRFRYAASAGQATPQMPAAYPAQRLPATSVGDLDARATDRDTRAQPGRRLRELPTPQTPADLHAYAEAQLAQVTVLSGQPILRTVRALPVDVARRAGIPVAPDASLLVAIAECDCDASAIIVGTPPDTRVRYLVWLADRRYPGARLIATAGSTFVREVLGDPSVPVPTVERGAP